MTSLAFSKKIALRYLWSKRSEAFITIITVISILGVAVGVMVLNIVMAIMTGFETELQDKIVGANSHIVVRSPSGSISGWQEIRKKIGAVEGVHSVSPFTYNQALLKTEEKSSGILIRGVEQGSAGAEQLSGYLKDNPQALEDLFAPPPVNITDENGEEALTTLPGILVGGELMRSYGLREGGPVSLLSPQVSSSPFGLVPKYKRFVVVGRYQSGLIEYESGIAYVDIHAAQSFFKLGDAVTGFEIRVKNIDESPAIAKKILDVLSEYPMIFFAQDWTETNKPLWEAIKLEKRVYFLVLLLIIIMASFSIVSTLVMIVLEKRKDIAVLKTLGASHKSISRIFKIQGAVIGGVGTISGLILAYGACKALQTYGFPIDERIFQMSTLPVKIEFINFFSVGIAAFLICFFATWYPARRAAGVQPSEALRY